MSTRFQWFKIDSLQPKTLKSASDRLLTEKYSDKRGFGIVLKEKRKDFVKGNYIEKTTLKQSVIDPFGKETIFEIPRYTNISFRLSSDCPELELMNPPRSVGQFLSFLGDCFDNKIAIEPIQFNLTTLIDWLKKNSEAITVQGAHVGNIVLSSTVSAEADIHGDDDVSPFVTSLLGKRKFVLSGTRAKFEALGESYCVEMSSAGRTKLISGDAALFSEFLRKYIAAAKQP